VYREGKLAYEIGDCVTAIEKLSAFKAKIKDKIESHKDFYGLIDKKIEACKNILTKGTMPQGQEGRFTRGAAY